MRSLIIGAAALLAVAVPGIASADVGGNIKLTWASIDDDAASSKDDVVALSGVVVADMEHTGWRVQFNGASSDVDTYGTSFAYSQAEAHATYDLGQFQVGVFTGVFNTNGWGYYEYGVEGAMNFDRGQIALSVAGATNSNGPFDDVTTVAATGHFNLTEDFSIGATISTTDYGNYGFGDNVDSWGVNLAYNIPNTNFTAGLGYRASEYNNNDVDFIGVSLAWRFGDGGNRAMPGAMALLPDAIALE